MDGSETVRSRIGNACDGCKARKVKCDGNNPCGYCIRRRCPLACHYSPPKRRAARRHTQPLTQQSTEQAHLSEPAFTSSQARTDANALVTDVRPVTRASHASGADEETEVPREARLLRDAQGRMVFIGDCAPLSFYQSVRQIVTTQVDANAFADQGNQRAVLANQPPRAEAGRHLRGMSRQPPHIPTETVPERVQRYLVITSGLVDLFESHKLPGEISRWAELSHSDDPIGAVYYLILAIGADQGTDPDAQSYFDYARERAFMGLSGDVSVHTVQAFILVALYMLNSGQINGAFLFFGIAVRAAYAVGVHRTEVNARFGSELGRQRDRLWKSLRVVDLYLSTSMGRPPGTSDVDCTVPCRSVDEHGHETFDLQNASLQIMLVVESLVVEVYSRRKISLAISEGISGQLKVWSWRWMQVLREVLAKTPRSEELPSVNAACHALATYYYAVILVSRPFLTYEVCRKLSESSANETLSRVGLTSGRTKLAEACIDAANLMTDTITDLISRNALPNRAPVLVSWLFASSLVFGLGLLGSFGRILEKFARSAIEGLENFAKSDAHAVQYVLIAKSLLASALDYLEKKEVGERLQRISSSRQLFGLVPKEAAHNETAESTSAQEITESNAGDKQDHIGFSARESTFAFPQQDLNMEDGAIDMSMLWPNTPDLGLFDRMLDTGSLANGQDWSGLNMFRIFEQDGSIDLMNYF